jgi:hypothetical protein
MVLLIPEVATHYAHVQVKVLRIVMALLKVLQDTQTGATEILTGYIGGRYQNSGRN